MNEPSRSAPAENDVAMTSNFLRDPKLRRQLFRGYSIEDTDALLERATVTVDKLRKTVTTLRQQPAAPEPTPVPAPASAPVPEPLPAAEAPPAAELPPANDVTARAGEVIVTAHQAVELLKEKAQHEADRIVEEAHGRAATVLADAARERSRLEQERAAATGIVDDARAEAARIVADAQRERDHIAAGSERLRSAAEELRRSWIAQVSQVIGQLSDAPAAPAAWTGDPAQIERELLARLQDSPHPAPTDAETPRQ